jgi:hypothetical protein
MDRESRRQRLIDALRHLTPEMKETLREKKDSSRRIGPTSFGTLHLNCSQRQGQIRAPFAGTICSIPS